MEQQRRGQQPAPEQPQRRTTTRSRRKKGRVFKNPWVYLLFVFGVSAVLAAFSWSAANDILALNKPEHKAVITVREDDSFGSVVKQLEENKLIGSKTLFRAFSLLAGGKGKIAPGTYELNSDMDFYAILNGLSSRSDSKMRTFVTIPEGKNIDEIFALLEENNVATAAKLQETAANHAYAFSFLQEIPLGDYKRLEGYLFPDTYQFYMGEDPLYVLNKMLLNFDTKLTDAMRGMIVNAGQSIHEIIIIASMIEKETDGDDRQNISSVIRNRLKNPTRDTAGFLQIDATIQYRLPKGERVTQDHYKNFVDPYNTYLNKGLPPGPIANPGMASILAAMTPADTGFYYYVLGKDGKHIFSKTWAEHQAAIASSK